MKALLAAGGRSTRMRPITHTINKHLIPLANKPMLEHALIKLAEAGIKDVILNINPGETEVMRKVFGNGERWRLQLTYVEQQGGARGIAHAVYNAKDYLRGDAFVFFLGDNIFLGSLRGMKERFEQEALDCLIALARVSDPKRFGVPDFNADGSLKRTVEKPQQPPSPFAVAGIYFFNDKYFDGFQTIQPSARGEYEITDMITWYIENGRVGHEEITGWWKDTGTPEALLEGNALLLDEMTWQEATHEARMDSSSRVSGKVSLGQGTVLGPDVLIRGPAVIGKNCSLDHAYVGPYTSIGNGVTLHNTEIEHSIVLDDAYINTHQRIVDSIIGKDARVTSSVDSLPRGHKMIIGDQSVVEL